MNSSITCVDPARVREFLILPPGSDQRKDWETHLEQCDRCRRLLLDVTSEALRNLPASQTATIDRADGQTLVKPLSTPSVRLREIDFLEPPRDPANLGRIGNYELICVVGRGGMGTVYKAHDELLHRTVALKMMSPELAVSDTPRQRFIREARAAAQVTHENVVTIHSVDESRPIPFLTMQYVEGVSLQDRMKDPSLDVDEIVRIGREIAAGLQAAHARGLVHRDVKPANILLESPGGRVKITDFGLARAVDDATLSQSGAVIGTPLYMAPEQARGEALDHRADLFSLGTVLYAMCAGGSPFRAGNTLAVLKRVCDDQPPSLRTLNAAIPQWLETIIVRLMAKDPSQRFSSAQEVIDRLTAKSAVDAQTAPTLPVPVYAVSVLEKKSRVPWIVGGVCMIALATVGVAYFGRESPKNESRVEKNVPDEKPIDPNANNIAIKRDVVEEGKIDPKILNATFDFPFGEFFKNSGMPFDPTGMLKIQKDLLDKQGFPFPFPIEPKKDTKRP